MMRMQITADVTPMKLGETLAGAPCHYQGMGLSSYALKVARFYACPDADHAGFCEAMHAVATPITRDARAVLFQLVVSLVAMAQTGEMDAKPLTDPERRILAVLRAALPPEMNA